MVIVLKALSELILALRDACTSHGHRTQKSRMELSAEYLELVWLGLDRIESGNRGILKAGPNTANRSPRMFSGNWAPALKTLEILETLGPMRRMSNASAAKETERERERERENSEKNRLQNTQQTFSNNKSHHKAEEA